MLSLPGFIDTPRKRAARRAVQARRAAKAARRPSWWAYLWG